MCKHFGVYWQMSIGNVVTHKRMLVSRDPECVNVLVAHHIMKPYRIVLFLQRQNAQANVGRAVIASEEEGTRNRA